MYNKKSEKCDSCNYCNYCDSCNFCYSCDYCNYCDSCNFCYSCDSCKDCNSCDYCNSCDSCNDCYSCESCYNCNHCKDCYFCYFCKNLKITEYNYFCWSNEFDSTTSKQQKKYRVFNVEVSEEEYESIKKINYQLEFDKNEDYTTRFQTAFKKMWYGLSQEQKKEFYNIPHFNWEWFTFITWIDKE